ncbi:MAG: hypothetical protein ACK4YP_18335, partial [Myxococcota bacterium]
MPNASPLVTYGIAGLAVAVAVLFVVAVSVAGRGGSGRAGRFAGVGTAAWMAPAGAFAYGGV